jgi:hypothetical protein
MDNQVSYTMRIPVRMTSFAIGSSSLNSSIEKDVVQFEYPRYALSSSIRICPQLDHQKIHPQLQQSVTKVLKNDLIVNNI